MGRLWSCSVCCTVPPVVERVRAYPLEVSVVALARWCGCMFVVPRACIYLLGNTFYGNRQAV